MSREDEELDEVMAALQDAFPEFVGEHELQKGEVVLIFYIMRKERVVRGLSSDGNHVQFPFEEFQDTIKHRGVLCFSCDDGELEFWVDDKNAQLFLACNSCKMEYRVVEGELVVIGN